MSTDRVQMDREREQEKKRGRNKEGFVNLNMSQHLTIYCFSISFITYFFRPFSTPDIFEWFPGAA